eukprot:Sspe_Gene.45067::Locus_22217_Transcript_1_1_Confidence_1.000_Length_2013::g.45067::m.45067
MRAVWALMKRYLSLEEDSEEELFKKTFVGISLLGLSPLILLMAFTILIGDFDFSNIEHASGLGAAVLVIAAAGYVAVTHRVPAALPNILAVFLTIAVLSVDLYASSTEAPYRAWPMMVLITQSLALLRSPLLKVLLVVVPLYFIVLAMDQWQAFGILTAFGWDEDTGCPSYPLSFTVAIEHAAFSIATFLGSNALFSLSREIERVRVNNTIESVQGVTQALTLLDILAAREALHNSLPPSLHDSLSTLISKLEFYRIYLPDSCLPFARDDPPEESLIYKDESASTSAQSFCSDSSTRSGVESLSKTQVIAKRQLTILIVGLKGVLEKTKTEEMGDYMSRWISFCASAIHSNRGILETFNGDRIVVSFNGAKPCTVHSTACLRCGITIFSKDIRQIYAGAATGKAVCGDMGSTDIRRYVIVGSVMRYASLTAQLAAEAKLRFLALGATLRDNPTMQARLLIERIQFKRSGTVHTVYAVESEITAVSDEEWMYQLNAIQGNNKWHVHNEGVQQIHAQAYTKALSLLERCTLHETLEVLSYLRDALDAETSPRLVVELSELGVEACGDKACVGGILWALRHPGFGPNGIRTAFETMSESVGSTPVIGPFHREGSPLQDNLVVPIKRQ